MPAYSTHYIFAKELENEVEKRIDFPLDENSFLIGAQGPDIFFFHRIMPWMIGKSHRKTGSALHRSKPAEILNGMRQYIKSNDNSIAKSYICGFITHYALDRKCHPYVYSLQDEILKVKTHTNPHTAHNNVEFAMDAYLLNKRLGIKNPSLFKTESTLALEQGAVDEIAKLINSFTKYATGKTVSVQNVCRAVYDMKYIQKLTTDVTGAKKVIVSAVETLISPITKNYKFSSFIKPKDLEKAKKYGNIDHKAWIFPNSKKVCNDSFEDLFEKAKFDAIDMITQFFAGNDCFEITKNLSFLSGVEVK